MEHIELLRLIAGREASLHTIKVVDDEPRARRDDSHNLDAYERWAARMWAEDNRNHHSTNEH